jgi:hypothetical protein
VEIHEPTGEDQHGEWQLTNPAPQAELPAPTDLVLLCTYKLALRAE